MQPLRTNGDSGGAYWAEIVVKMLQNAKNYRGRARVGYTITWSLKSAQNERVAADFVGTCSTCLRGELNRLQVYNEPNARCSASPLSALSVIF